MCIIYIHFFTNQLYTNIIIYIYMEASIPIGGLTMTPHRAPCAPRKWSLGHSHSPTRCRAYGTNSLVGEWAQRSRYVAFIAGWWIFTMANISSGLLFIVATSG